MNYLKAYTIASEVIPHHKKWKEIEAGRDDPKMSIEAYDYWNFRKVSILVT